MFVHVRSRVNYSNQGFQRQRLGNFAAITKTGGLYGWLIINNYNQGSISFLISKRYWLVLSLRQEKQEEGKKIEILGNNWQVHCKQI